MLKKVKKSIYSIAISILNFIIFIIAFFALLVFCLFLSFFIIPKLIKKDNSLFILTFVFLSISILFFQYFIFFRVLQYSSLVFLNKHTNLLLIFSILTINILGMWCLSQTKKWDKNYFNKYDDNFMKIQEDTKLRVNQRTIGVWIVSMLVFGILFSFGYLWGWLYLKESLKNKTEIFHCDRYNKIWIGGLDLYLYQLN
ncbi:hypothetical protein [Spiroplasma sp. DGKH1]|uniref:hypothetical protein n=1 Tax=Spiroplasma sp. DGKH1 TaxID=3050074 RepID=UPI0034C5C062